MTDSDEKKQKRERAKPVIRWKGIIKKCPRCGHWMAWVTLRYDKDGYPLGYWECRNCDATA